MEFKIARLTAFTGAVFAAAIVSSPAAAYIGPGLGLGVVASIFGAIAAFFMMLAGLIWYPVKVMLRKRREKNAAPSATPGEAAPAVEAAAKAPDAAE